MTANDSSVMNEEIMDDKLINYGAHGAMASLAKGICDGACVSGGEGWGTRDGANWWGRGLVW